MSAKENGDGITLTRLEVRNFQRIRAGVWDLSPGLNKLTSDGRNKQGKTSLLRAVRTLFEGAGAVPPEPRNAEASPDDEALVRAWLSNGWTIKRTFTEKGTYLYVEGPGGLEGRQKHITPWLGTGHFDPLGFFAMKAEEQARALLTLSSVPDLEEKLRELEHEEQRIYEERTPHISEKRRLRAVPKPEGERPEPISVKSEMEELGKLQKKQRESEDLIREHREKHRQADRALATAEQMEEECRSEVERLQQLLEQAEADLEQAEASTRKRRKALQEIEDTEVEAPDYSGQIEQVQARIEKAEAIQEALEPWKEWERAQDQLEDVTEAVDELTTEIEEVRERRTKLIAEADFPVDGLSFTAEGEVQLNGHPLEQASGREKIELGVTAALAHDPELRVVLVDEGNDLDMEGLEHLREICDEHGLQVVLARLGLEGAGELEVVDGWSPGARAEAETEAEEVPA